MFFSKSNENMPECCVAFIRVSSKKQVNGISLDVQRSVIYEWALKNKIEVLKYFEIVGSGRFIGDNPVFKEMMKYVKSKRLMKCCLAVYSVDRFGRNAIEGCSHLHELLKNGIPFCSVSESLYITKSRSIDAHRFNNFMQAADIESTRISERVKGANAYLKKLGWKFGKCPIGKEVVYVITDRKAEGLPPKNIRQFKTIRYDQNIIDEIKIHMDNKLNNVQILEKMKRRLFNRQPITLHTIAKIKSHILRHKNKQSDNEPEPEYVFVC